MPDPHNLRGCYNVSPKAHIASNAYIDRSGGVTIGDDAIVTEHVRIETHEHDMTPGHRGDESRITHSPLVIGEGAFIGYGSIILASCSSIGPHAVIGAGSVVTHDVPACEVWAGNPARFIRPVTPAPPSQVSTP